MNVGLKAILLVVALVFFLIAIISEENFQDMLALGLMALAGALLAEELPVGRSFGRTGTRHEVR